MQLSHVLAILAAVAVTNAQLPGIPTCANDCFFDALQSDDCSNLLDFACHCAKPELIATITPCVQEACSVAEQEEARSGVLDTCSSAGVPISVPPVTSSAAASASSAPASSAASSSVIEGPTFTLTPSPTMTPSSTEASVPTTTAMTSEAESNASSTPEPFTGAADRVQGCLGSVVAVLFAAAYWL